MSGVFTDLTGFVDSGAAAADLTQAKRLNENRGVAFIGGMKKGPFDVPGELARKWLITAGNPNNRPNSDVLFPWLNGMDITRRQLDRWIVDFPEAMPVTLASQYEDPYEHILAVVKPMKDGVRNARERARWWIHARTAPDLRKAVAPLERFIATARVSKYRLFVWIKPPVVCDGQLVVVARSDDVSLGILHSRFHEMWSLGLCTWLGVGNDPRYTPTTTFETFPFPDGLTPDRTPDEYTNNHTNAIREAARALVQLRDNWLNPPEWVDRVSEVAEGYPDRLVAKPGKEGNLKRRTLTNLYNSQPGWLVNAHRQLDEAVAAAYGWPSDLSDDQVLEKLLKLNLQRANGSRALRQ